MTQCYTATQAQPRNARQGLVSRRTSVHNSAVSFTAMQVSAIYSEVQYSAIYSEVQYGAVQFSALAVPWTMLMAVLGDQCLEGRHRGNTRNTRRRTGTGRDIVTE